MPLPENTIKITGLSAGTVKGGSLLATSEPDSSTPPVYSSSKVSAADIADFVANDKNYAELTETIDKTLVGAINEIAQGGGGGGSSTLAGLTDVDLTTPTDGQALVYDGNTSKWVNGTGGGGVVVSGTLTAGQTTITFTNPAISDNSRFDPYTSIFGVSPTNMSVSGTTLTVTFEVQSTDMTVLVEVK